MIAAFAVGLALAGPAPATREVADGVRLTRITRGSLRIDALEVDPSRRLRVLTGHDRVPGLERPSEMARRHHAVAGVNGGYFAVGAPDAGDPTGVVVSGGELVSEPVGARTALLIPKQGSARIAALRWHGTVAAGGRARLVDGVNRNQGRIPACGGVGGDRPTERIDAAVTCTDPSELVVYTPAYGGHTPEGVAVGDDILSGTGNAKRFLREDATLDLALRDGKNDIDPDDYAAVLGGAPRLVRHGRVHVTAAAEGRGADTGRARRTVAGVKQGGTVLLIAIGGRGATLLEAARTARRLGAVDAMSLDSGGSTTMTVGARAISRASEERAVANGLFILPGP